MMEQEYVANQSKNSGVWIIHNPDCGCIRHQVEERLQYSHPRYNYEQIGKTDNGGTVYTETPYLENEYYHANYCTKQEIMESDKRFRPCHVCSPPFPDRSGIKPIQIQVKNLRPEHLGKTFFDFGCLTSIAFTSEENAEGKAVLEFADIGRVILDYEYQLEYPRKVVHRAQ